MRYQTSPYSPSNRPRGGVQQQHQLLALPCCCCSGRFCVSVQQWWPGRSVSTCASSFEPARNLVAHACRLERQAKGRHSLLQPLRALAYIGIRRSTLHQALLKCIHRPSRSRRVCNTCIKNSTVRAHCESTLQRDGTLRLETAALCCRHCATTASERDPKLPGPQQHKTARLAAGTPARRSARRSRTANGPLAPR
jgi:hypothetical protein